MFLQFGYKQTISLVGVRGFDFMQLEHLCLTLEEETPCWSKSDDVQRICMVCCCVCGFLKCCTFCKAVKKYLILLEVVFGGLFISLCILVFDMLVFHGCYKG